MRSSRAGHNAGSAGRAVMYAAPAIVESANRSKTLSAIARRRAQRRMSGGALEPLQRLENLRAAAFRLLALFLLAFDDLLGRLAYEVRVAELGVDPFDVGVDLGDLLLEPRLLRRDIDDALERQRSDFAAYQELHRSGRRLVEIKNFGNAREAQ